MNTYRAIFAGLIVAGFGVPIGAYVTRPSVTSPLTQPSLQSLVTDVESLMAHGRRDEAVLANDRLLARDPENKFGLELARFIEAMAVADAREAEGDRVVCGVPLDRKLPEVNLDNVRLDDVIEFFSDVSGATIFVDWRGLERVGVRRDTAVTVRLKNLKFDAAFAAVLKSVPKSARGLTHQNDRGAIVIRAD